MCCRNRIFEEQNIIMKNTFKITVSFLLILISFPSFAQWDINGNSVNPGEKFGSLNDEDVDFVTNYQIDGKIRMTLKSNGFLGLGTKDPNAWQEINYCPPTGTPQSGLIVTMNKCNSNVVQVLEMSPDLIGGGMLSASGGGETGSGSSGTAFNVPFNFMTGNNTNLITPLYASESPIFWVRQRKPTGFNPGNSSTDEYDTKFIVMPDGSCGINVVNPRAALDVRGSQAWNRPAAIIGSRALGTGSVQNNLYQYYTQQVQFVPALKENGYNQIVKKGDQGMFFSDGKGLDGSNSRGSFVLAPWAEDGNPSVGGLRMDANGNMECHGTFRAVEVKINAQWWSDFVFDDDYKLMTLGQVESFINQYKHLPNVPSEKQVLEEGINVADMQAIQQQKIEELTLYLIQLKKELDALKAEVTGQKSSSH